MLFDDRLPHKRSTERRWAIQQGVSAHPRRDAGVWVYAPHFVGNPYQQLLMMGMPDVDIAAVGAQQYDEAVAALRSVRHVPGRVWHLHWLNRVLAYADSHAHAQQRIDHFTRQLDTMQQQGVRIVWTMHNVLPHESVFEDLEVRLRELICERAEMIHVMNPDSVSAAAPYFRIPAEKVVRVEHPGYQGYYSRRYSRAGARAHLGIAPEEPVSLVFGGIKPYKGLLELAHMFDDIARRHPRRVNLLIAGDAGDDAGTRELLELATAHQAIHVMPVKILPEDIWPLFLAADNTIIPYKASLNSGALVLALSMGRPVIASPTAGSTHLLAGGAGRLYGSAAELEHLLLDRAWLPAAAAEAQHMAHRMRPEHVSGVFAHVARAFLDQGVAAARAAAGPDGGLDD